MIKEPNRYGYIHLAAEIEPPRFLLPECKEKKSLVPELVKLGNKLKSSSDLAQRCDVFKAFIFPRN
jgi:hypothetical protein